MPVQQPSSEKREVMKDRYNYHCGMMFWMDSRLR